MKQLIAFCCLFCITTSFTPKDISWVAIGDSITYLNDHPEETAHKITKGYMTMVTEQLPNIHYINQGHNGWTSGGIAEQIDQLGIVKADVYSIFLGTNDWWQGRPVGTIADYTNNTGNGTVYGSFRIIINKLRSLNADAKIILITPMQRLDFVYVGDMHNNAWGSYKAKNGQLLSQFADAVIAIGKEEDVAVIDLFNKSGMTLHNMVKFKHVKDPATGLYKDLTYPDCILYPFNPDTDEYPYPAGAMDMTFDGLHPSDKGYAVITRMVVKELKKVK
ncbi:SGNH/GDSL hydrolase family protein [Limnovirga soli]|uniref:SGNH/GDSL hydrolase family protein n=1 Tax=Limnovirga soli TaxID=2656915 RepID=A0A8J8FGI4_9BACT|nr:SGNH/GDSL hydrolase family protein [Limnovirga soli]NNV56997.1 SGNH/GDSL hydrolase family protein [Limnovirga soli]